MGTKTDLNKAYATQHNLPQQTNSIASQQKTRTKQILNDRLHSCVNTDCDCKHFKTQKEAQQVFNSSNNDRFRLDRDKDGIACEHLPIN